MNKPIIVDNLGDIGPKKPEVPGPHRRVSGNQGLGKVETLEVTVFYKAWMLHGREYHTFNDDQQVNGKLIPLNLSVIGVMKQKWFAVDGITFEKPFGPLRVEEQGRLCMVIKEVLARQIEPVLPAPFNRDLLGIERIKNERN